MKKTGMGKIFETIREYHMIEPGMHITVGVSGGADSVCLLLALREYRTQVEFPMTVVHVEHGIRGAESAADGEFVRALCRELEVPFALKTCDAPGLAKERSLTVEEAGRMARYEFFEEVRRERGGRIAVAHNKNDQAETVLWNLARGSGLRGLGGIRPVREHIIRPLLFLERREIEELLLELGREWRTDHTNFQLDYTRNRIRLSILKEMEQELNGQAVEHISQAAADLQEMQEYLEQETEKASGCIRVERETEEVSGCIRVERETEEVSECIRVEREREEVSGCIRGEQESEKASGCTQAEQEKRTVRLFLPEFLEQPLLIQRELLKKCLRLIRGAQGMKDIGRVHIEALMELCRMPCGKECTLPGRIRAVREKTEVSFRSRKEEAGGILENPELSDTGLAWEIVLPPEGSRKAGHYTIHTRVLENSPALLKEILQEKKYTKWLSYDTIYSNVCFRRRRMGDYLVIDGRGGRKKLKDYMIDRKIPKDMRDEVPLIADGSHILWVVGYRISEAAKVNENTKRVLKIQIEEESK